MKIKVELNELEFSAIQNCISVSKSYYSGSSPKFTKELEKLEKKMWKILKNFRVSTK